MSETKDLPIHHRRILLLRACVEQAKIDGPGNRIALEIIEILNHSFYTGLFYGMLMSSCALGIGWLVFRGLSVK